MKGLIIIMLIELRLLMLIVIAILFIFFIFMLRRGKMDLKYCLVWLFGLFGIAVFCIFPGLLFGLSDFLGIEVAANMLFLICIAFLACICISLTVVVSRLSNRLRQLTQNIAILEYESRINNGGSDDGGIEKKQNHMDL
jgi:hypothetical protein